MSFHHQQEPTSNQLNTKNAHFSHFANFSGSLYSGIPCVLRMITIIINNNNIVIIVIMINIMTSMIKMIVIKITIKTNSTPTDLISLLVVFVSLFSTVSFQMSPQIEDEDQDLDQSPRLICLIRSRPQDQYDLHQEQDHRHQDAHLDQPLQLLYLITS